MARAGDDALMIPSARRLMNSLRDMGYDTPGAVADLVDNSIDADARNIRIDIHRAGADSWIRIADDGEGMSRSRLDEAMRYGSSRSYSDSDLGVFGLGLKTASLSQCRRLTVASRTSPRGRIEVRRWDLDRVAQQDSWELERIQASECPRHLLDPIGRSGGTVVLWERLDRVLDYARPHGSAAMSRLDSLRDEIAEHLAMVFHRFIDGDLRKGRKRIAITIDGDWLDAWDPFARNEEQTVELRRQWIPLRHGEKTHRVVVRPFILPNQVQFSSPEAHMAAAGPKRWNRQQGLYIYRRDRLVQSGGWNRLRTMDEHSKLARISVDVPAEADSSFRTNVSKMMVAIPSEVRPALRVLISGVVGQAQDVYRQRLQLVSSQDRTHEPGESTVGDLGSESEWRLGDHWNRVVSVLDAELGDEPDRLRSILQKLIVATAPGAAAQADAS